MTDFRTTLACVALVAPLIQAQDIAPKESERDPVFSALSEGFGRDDSTDVTLDFNASMPSLVTDDDGIPVLVTGKHPGIHGLDAFDEESEPVVPEPEGVSVSVEPGEGGHSRVNASEVKLLAPFAAKPLFQPPAGWRLEHPESVPAFVREVPLANGTRISLSIRPHLLVPDADGDQVLSVNEPGYEPALRFAQTGTMGAVLSESVERMEEDSIKVGAALDRLSQLLASLPSAEAPPGPDESPESK